MRGVKCRRKVEMLQDVLHKLSLFWQVIMFLLQKQQQKYLHITIYSWVSSNARWMSLQRHIAREACLTKSRYIILLSDMELLLNNKRWMNGYEECVSFKGEATRLSSSVHLKSWEPYQSQRVTAVSKKTSDILQLEYYVPILTHPS